MTQDNAWDVSPSWAELKAERDALAALLAEAEGVMPVTTNMPEARIKADYIERVDAALGRSGDAL